MYKLEAYLFTRCLLLVQIHSLLVTRCKIRRYSLRNSLVTRCRSCLLQNVTCYSLQSYSLKKTTRYSLQNSLATHCRSCSLQKFTRYSLQNSLVTRCKSCSLQISLVTCCKIRSVLVAEVSRCKKNHSPLVETVTSQ